MENKVGLILKIWTCLTRVYLFASINHLVHWNSGRNIMDLFKIKQMSIHSIFKPYHQTVLARQGLHGLMPKAHTEALHNTTTSHISIQTHFNRLSTHMSLGLSPNAESPFTVKTQKAPKPVNSAWIIEGSCIGLVECFLGQNFCFPPWPLQSRRGEKKCCTSPRN